VKTADEIAAELSKGLDARHIAQRQAFGNNGPKLSYIEAHHAIREANRIFGFDGWQRTTDSVTLVQSEQKPRQNGGDLWWIGYVAKCTIRVESKDWPMVVREGTGFGQGQDVDLGKAHESAIKEAESDAMKRALMTFGNPFGLALYDKAQEHVEKAPQAARSARPEPTAATADRWTAAELKTAMLEHGVKGQMFAPVFNLEPKELNAPRLMLEVAGWMTANPKKTLIDLMNLVISKQPFEEDLPEPTPADLTPRADTRMFEGVA